MQESFVSLVFVFLFQATFSKAAFLPRFKFWPVAERTSVAYRWTDQNTSKSLILRSDARERSDKYGTGDLDATTLAGYGDCTSLTEARRLLQDRLGSIHSEGDRGGHLDRNSNLRFGSITIPAGASSISISDGDLAIQTRHVNRKYRVTDLIELSGDRDADRAALAVLGVLIGSSILAIVANQNLPGPEILRFLVVWTFSFAPLIVVGYGIADADKLQSLLTLVLHAFFPAYRQRMIQHEAGHFLLAHLLGWPIRGYRANAVKNAVEFFPFADEDRGADRARQLGFDAMKLSTETVPNVADTSKRSNVPYFSEAGRGSSVIQEKFRSRLEKRKDFGSLNKLPTDNMPTSTWPFRGFSDAELDQLAVISLAGVCAEILAFGNAEGGVADLGQLRQILNSASDELSDRDVDNRIRFALSFALTQLRRHLGLLDAVAAVMERGGSVEECVVSIEAYPNPSGQDGILSDYEVRRRQQFRDQSYSFIENIFLSGDRNVDTVENRLVEGKGGGYRRATSRLIGDDPLYAAIAVSCIFLIWASSGGLALH